MLYLSIHTFPKSFMIVLRIKTFFLIISDWAIPLRSCMKMCETRSKTHFYYFETL